MPGRRIESDGEKQIRNTRSHGMGAFLKTVSKGIEPVERDLFHGV